MGKNYGIESDVESVGEGASEIVGMSSGLSDEDKKAPEVDRAPAAQPKAPKGDSLPVQKVESKERHMVQFFLYRTDGKQNFTATKIYIESPEYFNPQQGRTMSDFGKAVYVEFKNGVYVSKDPDITSFLRAYMNGGEYTWRGAVRVKAAETFALFTISEELRVRTTDGENVRVNKVSTPRSFLETLPLESVVEYAKSVGMAVNGKLDKKAILDMLATNGHVS